MGSLSWAGFTGTGNGTQILNHGADQCVALANLYNESVIGGAFVPVGSAHQWWNEFWSYPTLNENYYQVAADQNPRAGDIFVSRYGLYNGPHGHIGVVVRDWDGNTFGTMEQNAGTWRYTGRYNRTKAYMLGYLRPRNNPAGVELNSTQRQVGSEPVNRRTAPNTSGAPIDPQLDPGEVGNFDGWIRGENVNGIDIWFRGISGNWFWSGGFTSQSVDGLANLNPASPSISANQRRAGASAINRRTEPNTGAAKVDPMIDPGTVVTMAGWMKGEAVEGIDTWFKSTDGTWSWAGAFTSADTANLTDLTPAPTPPTPTPDPTKDRRTVGSEPVRRRREPNTTSEAVEPMLPAGETITVAGWIKGQDVEGINIWYKGLTGFYSWAGAFTSQDTTGLIDLNPVTPTPAPVPAADERTVGDTDGYRRASATRNSAADPTMLKAGETVKIAGWVAGEVIDGIGTWYKLFNTNLYAWSGIFTKTDTFGLTELNVTTVTPGTVPDTGRSSVAELIPNWSEAGPEVNPVFPRPLMVTNRYQLPADIKETSSDVSLNGYTIGRPVLPESVGLPPINHFVLHHVAGTSLSGAVATLSGAKGAPTASYAVEGKNLVSMVPEDCAPWTNGRWKSNLHSITFEMVNAGGSSSSGFLPPSDDTCETVAHAMARACMRWNMAVELEYGINVFGHKDVSKSSTACPGALDVKKIVARANEIMAEYKKNLNPDQTDSGTTPTPPPTPTPDTDDVAIAEALDVINAKIEEISNILKGKE